MISLKELYLKNFLSHVDTTLVLEQYSGLVLVEGQSSDGHYSSNGSGKSTLLEGIVYALTGDTLRGVSVNDVVNRNYKKDAQATLRFLKGDTEYRASRYRKDSTHGDAIVLMKADENISKRVTKESQKLLEDILGISYEVLVSTMLLGEGLSARFTQLSDPGKKSLIESTLNLQYDMNDIRARANNKLTQLRLELSNLQGKLSAMRDLATLDVEYTKEQIERLAERRAQLTSMNNSMQDSVNNLIARNYQLSERIQVINTALLNRSSLEDDESRVSREIAQKVSELQSMQTSTEIPRCITCHQPLSTYEAISAVELRYSEEIKHLNDSLRAIRDKIESLPPQSVLEESREKMKAESASLDEQLAKLNSDMNILMSEYWSIDATIKQLNASIVDYEHSEFSIASLEDQEKALARDIVKYEYFYKLFSPTGIIVNILADAIEYINQRLATYSSVLLEKDYKINFVKGKISLVDSKGSSYQSLSNGEKRRLDIAIQFSLHDYVHTYCGNSVDTMFIDEILDTLDDIGIENIITVLRLKLEYCKLSRIFVISHNSELKSYFDRVVTVVKDSRGDSKILSN